MAVGALALQREEQVARLDLARIEGDAARLEGAMDGCRRWRRRFRRRSTARSCRALPRDRDVVERQHLMSPPTIWPCSWPLPASRMMSSGPASAIAAAIASRRPPISRAPGAPARMSRRIAAGSSLRGLSSVTMTRSARRAATAPISGALADVAVAAGAEDDDQPARWHAAAAPRSPLRSRRAYGHNRHRPARRRG